MKKIGFLYTRLRAEEKYLLEELEKRPNVELVRVKDDGQFFDISRIPEPVDVLFERSVSYSRGLYISKIYEANGVKVVNSTQVAERCGDKYVTSQILVQNGIPTPKVLMAFDEESALAAVDAMGYPCVLKPVVERDYRRKILRLVSLPSAETPVDGSSHAVYKRVRSAGCVLRIRL